MFFKWRRARMTNKLTNFRAHRRKQQQGNQLIEGKVASSHLCYTVSPGRSMLLTLIRRLDKTSSSMKKEIWQHRDRKEWNEETTRRQIRGVTVKAREQSNKEERVLQQYKY